MFNVEESWILHVQTSSPLLMYGFTQLLYTHSRVASIVFHVTDLIGDTYV